jgi:hypothetical protein
MKEHVGMCNSCGADIYCHDGFIGGVVVKPGTLVCFPCMEEGEKEKPQ